MACAVSAAQAFCARPAGESSVCPPRAVAEHARVRQDRRVAVAGEADAPARGHLVAVTPGEVTVVRFVGAGTNATADVAAEAGRRAVPARVDAADVPGRRPEGRQRGGARRTAEACASDQQGGGEEQEMRTPSQLHACTKSRPRRQPTASVLRGRTATLSLAGQEGHVPGWYLAAFVTGRYWRVNVPRRNPDP